MQWVATTHRWAATSVNVIVCTCWLVDGFHVALDSNSIQGLYHQFTLLELPRGPCKPPGPSTDGVLTWNPHCAHGLEIFVECEYAGYQYSMEWYFSTMLRDNPKYLAVDPVEAKYVYFPHCASQVYFSIRQSTNATHWEAIARTEVGYLVPMLRWAHGTPQHKRYSGKNFWTVFSMDLGRQDFPRSAAWLEKWSVGSLTGSEHWTQEHQFRLSPNISELDLLFSTDQVPTNCWEEDSVPVAEANDMFPARNFREYDTVISIPSRFSFNEARSRTFDGRPTLAFFAGSPNSCARRHVLELYSGVPGFDVSTLVPGGDVAYSEKMWSARFCLTMRGSSHTNNVRLYDILAHGCIPVVISDDMQPPLDQLIPWEDLAIFIPTSMIPHLEYILRNTISESRQRQIFANIILGKNEGYDEARVDGILAQSHGTLDKETLWSGLHAARVFNWHGNDFWFLFFFDVAMKLSDRMAGVSSKRRTAPRLKSSISGEGARRRLFRWQRMDWSKESDDAVLEKRSRSNGANDATLLSLPKMLLTTLHLIYSAAQRMKGYIPGVIIECGVAAAEHTAQLLRLFGCASPAGFDVIDSRDGVGAKLAVVSLEPSAGVFAELQRRSRPTARERAERAVLHGWVDIGWVGVAGQLGRRNEHELEDTSGHRRRRSGELDHIWRLGKDAALPSRVYEEVFLLHIGPTCNAAAALAAMTDASSISIKFVLFSGSTHRSFGGLVGIADALAAREASSAWLCFCPAASGRWRPVFSPYEDSQSSTPILLCGRESDSDLDTVVRLLSGGGVNAGLPPARWGAMPPYLSRAAALIRVHKDEPVTIPGIAAASFRGRFLYAAI